MHFYAFMPNCQWLKIILVFIEEVHLSKRNFLMITVIFMVLLFSALLVGCGTSATNTSPVPSGSTGTSVDTPATTAVPSANAADGQALMTAQCGRCHPLSRVTSKQKTAAEWKITVDRMITRGAKLTPQEEQALIDYLAQNY